MSYPTGCLASKAQWAQRQHFLEEYRALNIEHFAALIEKSHQQTPPPREETIFEQGTRGHFENPVTDLLGFFLDPSGVHGLGACFLRALFECLKEDGLEDSGLTESPARELRTEQGNRLDLLLQGNGWTLVLENKIGHAQVNPISDYEAYARTQLQNPEDRLLYVVLSPLGESAWPGWTGVSYRQLIDAARRELATVLMNKSFEKWHAYARDYLLHLETITTERLMDDSALSFVFENLHSIEALNRLKEQALNALDERILEAFSSRVEGYEAYKTRQKWEHGPALRYASNHWEWDSSVLLYLSCEAGVLMPKVFVYVVVDSPELIAEARGLFADSAEHWLESKDRVAGFRWDLAQFDEQSVIDVLCEKMQRLMVFESRVRPLILART